MDSRELQQIVEPDAAVPNIFDFVDANDVDSLKVELKAAEFLWWVCQQCNRNSIAWMSTANPNEAILKEATKNLAKLL